MKCPKCISENPEGASFCNKCGNRLLIDCPECGHANPTGSEFCNRCGHKIGEEKEETPRGPEGERKHVTVLFSDLSGYTAMSEKFDPEEIREIMSRIFGEIVQVVTKYEGFIEKFIGDAVVALFGVPKAHEDDPIRAIRAAREIHDLVTAMSPQLDTKVGGSLSMHSGINTGLVVTGVVNLEKGTHGVSGDTINLASRLAAMAKAGEILVGPETYCHVEGYFTFESLEPTMIKGKIEPVSVYKVLAAKERPVTTHRPSGRRTILIGRKVEITQLKRAIEHLHQGRGTTFCICGELGTGKSRLVEEFKGTLDPQIARWMEGHAYAYTQNIPYYPFIDMLDRLFQIEDGDPPERVRGKIESGVEGFIGRQKDVVPWIGSLYALTYPDLEGISPEVWKLGLFRAVQTVVTAPARRRPTVVCLEDLHWADPSTLELLRFLLSEVRHPVLFLCVYRLPFSLFTSQELGTMRGSCEEIRLQDLSYSETQDMLESLLETATLPGDLLGFVRERTDGNPFYVEEVINSLIEAEALVRENGGWKSARLISKCDIPSTLHGVISARLDRLEREMKLILQEASVIGRAFLYQILKEMTQLTNQVDRCLSVLEQMDLIRTRSLHPELEYIFKHALTREVVYDGLLKRDRQALHERIGLVMERLFGDRLSEFYEALALHFKSGHSADKAVDYLMKSGEKCLKRYSVEESHQHFKEAFGLLKERPQLTREEKTLLVDLLIRWAFVFHYRGDFKGLTQLLREHQTLAKDLGDRARLGMFYTLLGLALYQTERIGEAYKHLCHALELGEETGNQQATGYACTWLSWVCPELGLLDEAVQCGQRAIQISRRQESEDYLLFNSLAGIGLAHYYRGDRKRALEAGEALLEYGQRQNNIRSLGLGHFVVGCSYLIEADFTSAIDSFRRAVEVSADPWYSQFPRLLLGLSYASVSRFQDAEDTVDVMMKYGRQFGTDLITTPARVVQGIVSIGKGELDRGLRILESAQKEHLKGERRYVYAAVEEIIGRIYVQVVEGVPVRVPLLKNIGFLVKNIPFGKRRAEDHLNQSIRVAKEIGAKGTLGMAYLDLGLLERAKGSKDLAREWLSAAIEILTQCDAKGYLEQAKRALGSLV